MPQPTTTSSGLASPAGFAAVALPLVAMACALALLALPVRLPIGAMYWDNVIYIDGAWRMLEGQLPATDFFAPAGPLAYALAALLLRLFPDGQSVLLSSFSLLLVTAPLMALIAFDVARNKPITALALVIPFLFYALLPFNTSAYYPFPGADGFAIYNRQGSQLLYLLVAAMLFTRSTGIKVTTVAVAMLAMFLVKITAFLAGGLICLVALLAGRIRIVPALIVAAIFLAAIAVLELTTGMISAYLLDIVALVTMNSGGLVGRLVQALSRTFTTSLSTGLLALMLLFWVRPKPQAGAWPLVILDHPAIWIGVTLVAGLFFESQNTGGQELIFLWPPVLMALPSLVNWLTRPVRIALVVLLAATAVLVPFANTAQSAARALAGMLRDAPVDLPGMRSLDDVTARAEVRTRADIMLKDYVSERDNLERLAKADQLPSPLLYSDPDFQVGWLMTTSEAVAALDALKAKGLSFETVMTLDFVNPFPFLTGTAGPRYIAIGADPGRAVPPPDERTLAAVTDTDLILLPMCPYTAANLKLEQIYAPALAGRTRAALTPCYDVFLKPGVTLP